MLCLNFLDIVLLVDTTRTRSPEKVFRTKQETTWI